MRPNADKVAAIIAEIAQAEIMPRFGALSPDEIKTKSTPNDLVTEVDEKTEAALKAALCALYPGSVFIGEEGVAADPDSLKALDGDGVFWVVDPLDGTRNFVRGVPEFATIVALVENGETVGGWIYGVTDETCAVAERGGGVCWGDEPLVVTPFNSEVYSGLRSVGWLSPQWAAQIAPNLKTTFHTAAHHCSAYAYLNVARGLYDFKLSSRIHPWDHAAGALILEETGGRVAYIDDDTRYRPGSSVDRPLLASAAGRDWIAIAEGLTAPTDNLSIDS